MESGIIPCFCTSVSPLIKRGRWRRRFCGVDRLLLQHQRITLLKTISYFRGAKLDYRLPQHRQQELGKKNEIPAGWPEQGGPPDKVPAKQRMVLSAFQPGGAPRDLPFQDRP